MPADQPTVATRRVAVVDDDDVTRTGSAVLLRRHGAVEEVVELTLAQALSHQRWSDIDVVLLDPVDRDDPVDQISGAKVAERIRAATTRSSPRIVVVSGVAEDHAVRRRLWEAGADAYLRRRTLRDGSVLAQTVVHPMAGNRFGRPADHEVQYRLGITARSRVNLGVAAAFTECLVPQAGWVGPRGRDRLARRRRFNQAARLQPMGSDGRVPDRQQDAPSLLQIQRFVAWATRVDHPHSGNDDLSRVNLDGVTVEAVR